MIQGRQAKDNLVYNMPEGPQVGDRILGIFNERYVTVHKREWRLADNKWMLTIWVR